MNTDMETFYTIGQIAHAAAVPASTIRFYERAGLLEPCKRTGARYRLYDGAALARLRFIRAALASGFTVKDVAALLPLRDGNTARATTQCRETVRGLIRERLHEVATHLDELGRIQVTLRLLLESCLATQEPTDCPVLEELDAASSNKTLPGGDLPLDLEPRFKR